nr:hypothetical protein [Tanacetum cinerariifolium]
MKDSIAYKTYCAFGSGKEIPKPKYVWPSTRGKTVQPPKASPGQKLKTTAKVAKSGKKKLPATVPKAKGLETLSEIALSEVEQIKLATKRSKKDFHMSHASGSDEDDTDEETDVNDDSKGTESDNDRDDLTHPKLSTYKADDEEEDEGKIDNDEVSSYHRVYTPPNHQLTNEDENQEADDEVKEGEEKQQQQEEELYGDLNINLQRMQHQSSSVSSDLVSKFINPSLDIGRSLSQKYTTSVTKTKAADYGQVMWIEDKGQDYYSNQSQDHEMVQLQSSGGDYYAMNQNRLMRTDELHKFSDGTLNHVRTALNDIATRTEMDYLLKRKWSKQDKQRARVMINAIDRKLRDRRLMRNLEKFVGGRPYEGDLRLLERTI